MSKDAIIRTTGLTKVFRDFWKRPRVRAVDNLSLSVETGKVLGLLGPNGSGKSTTIKMLLGLVRPTAGDIRIMGFAPDSEHIRSRIGYLPEISHLYHYLTPRETLKFHGGLFGLPSAAIRERTEQLLAMCGIADAADRPVGEFSKGMARRVGLAQALINNPEIVILDEPTSGLDPVGRRDVKDLVRALAGQGKTVLLSSHLLGEVEDVCDSVAIMFRGKLITEGRLDAILSRDEQTRLTIPSLASDKLAQICAGIERDAGSKPVVDHPAMTLEQFFIATLEKEDGRFSKSLEVAQFLQGDDRSGKPAQKEGSEK